MDFSDRIKALAVRIPNQMGSIETEEATKNAFVMPFISELGYNVFDPTEVVPEFTADVGVKKGEKVDYAIMQDGQPIMLFECKWCGADLGDVHKSQLFRYFTVTPARIGVLTNGIVFEFYTDLDDRNKMDDKPFLIVDLLDLSDSLLRELKRLSKDAYDLEEIVSAAGELKYARELKRFLAREFRSPNEEFLRLLIDSVYSGRITERVREEFRPIVQRALRSFINEQVNQRLRTALEEGGRDSATTPASTDVVPEVDEPDADESEIVTTEEELEGFYIAKSILRTTVDVERIFMRDVRSYCSVLLDDNNRQPVMRMYFHSSNKYIGLFDEEKNLTRVQIEDLDDIYDHAEQLRATVEHYEDDV